MSIPHIPILPAHCQLGMPQCCHALICASNLWHQIISPGWRLSNASNKNSWETYWEGERGVLLNMWLSANNFQQSRNSKYAENFCALPTQILKKNNYAPVWRLNFVTPLILCRPIITQLQTLDFHLQYHVHCKIITVQNIIHTYNLSAGRIGWSSIGTMLTMSSKVKKEQKQ